MDHKKIRAVGAGILVAVWALLTGFSWFGPAKQTSEAERRPLEQMPEITMQSILQGDFMTDFEDYSLDQFPLRDTFRKIKAITHNYILRQKDNNGIYIADGYAAQLEYPLNPQSISYAASRFEAVYNTLLRTGRCKIYAAVVPDKGCYLAEENGYLSLDYAEMVSQLSGQMPYATFIDLLDSLSEENYYFTDTHWRQETILPVAEKLCQAMGAQAPKAEDFTKVEVERPFYGVYYGQAALPMDAETMYYLDSELLRNCRVYDYETMRYGQVYDMAAMSKSDLYDLFLSGAKPLLTIENPNATTNKELIIFRDSFGSSIAPLLVQGYAKVTLVDIRYIHIPLLRSYLQMRNQDVLFLYSTLILNSSSALK